MKNQKIHILLADDHPIVRKGLALIINSQKDMEVVGEASSGQEAIDLTRLLHPDVVITDIGMPNISGMEAARIISADFPETAVIGLSMYSEIEVGDSMRKAGAVGYISKSESTEAIFMVIRNAVDMNRK